MPLIQMVGMPCSGKTTRAKEIEKYLLEETKLNVVLINEESLNFDKQSFYADPSKEKILRAAFKNEVEKNISDHTIVILDTMNYIKGFRYELYTLCRNSKTTLCLVYCETNQEWAAKINGDRDNGLTKELFDDLCNRMEYPIATNRWDKPLFNVKKDDETLPLSEIKDALLSGKKPRDPVSTKKDNDLNVNYITKLDQNCQQIIQEIVSQQGQHAVGDTYPIECVKGVKNKYKQINILTAIDLKKLKLEFTNYSKMHPPAEDKIHEQFLEFINIRQQQDDDY